MVASIIYKPEERTRSGLLGGWEKKFRAVLNPFHAETSSVELSAVMSQDNLSLPRIFITNSTTKLLEHLKVTSRTDGFTSWQKHNHYAVFNIPNDSYHGLMG
jgi:hypothetical protein